MQPGSRLAEFADISDMGCERERSQEDPKVVVLKVVRVESSFIDIGKMGRGKDVRAGVSGKPSWTFKFPTSVRFPSGDVE